MSRTAEAPLPQLYRFSWPIYIILVLLAFLVNFPGRLDPDTIDMITMGMHPQFLYSWHAPLLTWLYSLFTPALGQPAGALLVQVLLLFVYPATVPVRTEARGVTVATAAVAIARGIFIAALIAIAGQIVKDPVVIGGALCLLALLDLSRNSPNDGKWLAWKIVAAFLIFGARPTNFVILATAGAIYAYFVFGPGRRLVYVLLFIFAASAAAVPVTHYIDEDVFNARPVAEQRALIIFDAAGISTNLGQNVFAELDGWPADKVRPPWECYKPIRWDDFKWNQCGEYVRLFDQVMDKPGAPKSDVRWWMSIIVRHPISYMLHRIAYTLELMRGEWTIVGWRQPYARNTPKDFYLLSGAVDGGKDKGGGTHGLNMTQEIQMWKPTIAYVPFGWVAARIFARTTSAWWGLFLCVTTLMWNWYNLRKHRDVDLTAVTSSAIGLGTLLMFAMLGQAGDGRYTTLVLVCGIVSLLRTIDPAVFPAVMARRGS